MPIIRTVFRPWEDVEVSEAEAASMERMGLLSASGSVEPGPDPDADKAAGRIERFTSDEDFLASFESPETMPDPTPPAKPRRVKTATTAPAEEVNTDGSSEEGGSQAEEG